MTRPFSDDPRIARYELERVKDLLGHIQMDRQAFLELGLDTTDIDAALATVKRHSHRLQEVTKQRIESRGRSKKIPRLSDDHVPGYYLFLDECGTHITKSVDSNFPVFCLSGVIVPKSEYEAFDVTWKSWKNKYLGSPDVITHEPDVRHFNRAFTRADEGERLQLSSDLDKILTQLEFSCISAVIDMRAFVQEHPDNHVDDYLPKSCYLMALTFVMERFLHFLQNRGEDAKGLVIAESRGLLEDAIVHSEFIRLHLRGTQFISEADFRYQLRPYIEFYRKARNNSGLQIADLAARPCADIVLDPNSTPSRWNVIKEKLYDGLKGAPHSYGLKVFPLNSVNDPFPNLPRKAKGDAETASPSPTSLC